MAIAIPSVTKYITQSRKKTVATTIDNYMSALTNQVNDMEYVFTATNTVYAVPIECIALERGGTNPFGKWHQSNDAYWAYVLVQYDDNTSSYTYGFTFKDSAGYGLYPTTSEKLKESGSQILTDLNLIRPTNGKITNITTKDNWTGFNVTNDTDLIVLVASSEGQTGNGTTTCTLCQKGDNYTQVEEEKNNNSNPENREGYLSGTWRFDSLLVEASFEHFYTVNIDFSTNYNGNTTYYSSMVFYTDENLGSPDFAISYQYADDGTYIDVYISDFDEKPWCEDGAQTITFITEQQVPIEFYNWFIANATKIN